MTVRLVGVFAHPDDDSYLIGGTLLLHRGRVEPAFVFATSGGAGPIASPSLATRQTLACVREGEQRAYLEAIGYAGAPVRFLRHPDYHLPEAPFERLVGEVEAVLREVRPHLVVSFGPDGMTSHHDHIRAGEAAAEAFRRARAAAGEPADAFLRLYQAAYPRSEVDRFYAAVRRGRFDYGEEGRLFDITGVPDERIACGWTRARFASASGPPSSATGPSVPSTSASPSRCAGSCWTPSASCGPSRRGSRARRPWATSSPDWTLSPDWTPAERAARRAGVTPWPPGPGDVVLDAPVGVEVRR